MLLPSPINPRHSTLAEALAVPGDDYERRLMAALGRRNPIAHAVIYGDRKRNKGREHALSKGLLKGKYTLPNPWEVVEQYDVACYLNRRLEQQNALDTLLCWTHPPNETASKAEAGKKSVLGVSPGVPDILCWGGFRYDGILYPGLAIELKRRDGVEADLSDKQRWWLERLTMAGWLTCWARGAGPAVAVIELCYGRSWL